MRKRFSGIMVLIFICTAFFSGCEFQSEKTVSGIEITNEPNITVYTAGEFFDKAGMAVEAQYSDGTKEIVKGYTVSPSGALAVSDTFVTVTYGGKQAQQPITVNPLPGTLTGISITRAPDRTSYFTGEPFDKTGMKVEARYSDGTGTEITDYTVMPSGALNESNTFVNIVYGAFAERQEITVEAVALSGIELTRGADRTSYYEGELFSPDGMTVTAVYNNGERSVVSNYDYSPSAALTADNTEITVLYGGKTAVQAVAVIAVARIEITVAPDKTSYYEGNSFSPEGMTVTAFYSDGAESIVTGYDFSPKHSLTKSDTVITVSFCGKTAEQSVTVGAGSVKRGAGYNFTTNETTSSSSAMAAEDMEALMSGENGIRWFYNWGASQNSTVAAASKERNLSFVPMTWRYLNDNDENNIRKYVAENPQCEYILACNEPNLADQANLTPKQYAENSNGWTRLVRFAKELNLKIVSPAMNWGTNAGYSDPIIWLDEFFAHPNVDLDDVYAISIHDYSGYASAVKSFVEKFKKYNKPIWVTEFCAWNKDGNLSSAAVQMRYMSQTCAYFELEPMIERYAWFIPKGSALDSETAFPYNKLLRKTNPVELTDIGKVYTNMSVCNKEMFVPAGKKMDAAQYADNNISDFIGSSGWSDTVLFRPTADTDKTAGILDIHNFTSGKWVEYRVDVQQAGSYKLTLRYQTTAVANMSVLIDGTAVTVAALNSSEWTSASVDLGALGVGKHTIRLRVTSGECSLNWLQLIKI